MEASPFLEKANVAKRIYLVSNFLSRAKDDEGGEIVSTLVDRMQVRETQPLSYLQRSFCSDSTHVHV